jgi:hypothetical protein
MVETMVAGGGAEGRKLVQGDEGRVFIAGADRGEAV